MNSFAGKLMSSIFSGDFYILLFAVLAGTILVSVLRVAEKVEEEVKLCHADPNKRFAADLAGRLNTGYNFFTTMITIFPLLGMFGTVRALIRINLGGEMDSFRQEFFGALTSTAWGIIFAVIFKLINAYFEYRIVSQIEAAEKLQDERLVKTIRNGEQNDEER